LQKKAAEVRVPFDGRIRFPGGKMDEREPSLRTDLAGAVLCSIIMRSLFACVQI
jgi:hypothetical protein